LVGMDVVPKKKILEMDLVIDDRVWNWIEKKMASSSR
jgi:hypothetical protein